MPPWLGAAVSVPTSTLLFWCLAPFLVDITKADMHAGILFICVGLLFPATVTLLNFESNRLMGPNIAGAISGLAPIFAVLLALALLGESIHLLQFLGITAIVAGVVFMYRERQQNLQRWSLWMLSLPLAGCCPACHQTGIGTLAESRCSCGAWLHCFVCSSHFCRVSPRPETCSSFRSPRCPLVCCGRTMQRIKRTFLICGTRLWTCHPCRATGCQLSPCHTSTKLRIS
jgi:uncharacterized membrane protein